MPGTIGEFNPTLLAQCEPMPVPSNAEQMPVHVTEWGDTGPVVMLVHGGVQGGIGGGPANFLRQKPLVEKGWRLRLIDRPGFGGSPSRGPDDMSADAVLIAGMLGDGTHLIGHSYGGAEALLAAARNPGAVRSLTLVEPALQPMLATDPESAGSTASKQAIDIIMKTLMTAKTPGDYAISFLSSLGANQEGGDNPIAAGLKANPVAANVLGCSLLRAKMESPDVMRAAADAVKAAGIPVLVISGSYSEAQGATGKAIARMTGGRHVVVEATNHFLQQSSPEVFNEAVDEFLRECEGRRRVG
jgi:pimeloyl-ACP methyl ester carboxylesterase